MSTKNALALWTLIGMLLVSGCASGPVHHVSSDVDFSFIRKVAVVPFRNLSADRFATQRMHSVFVSELLQFEGLEVTDPGEVFQAFSDLRMTTDLPPTPEQIVELGRRLGVDAVFTGTVEEYGLERFGGNQIYAVTALFGMAETQSGSAIWSAQVRTDGGSFWKSLFGGQPTSLYDVSSDAVREALGTLLGDARGETPRDPREPEPLMHA